MASVDVRRSWAFAPGHVTGVFAPSLESPDPRGRGSVGAGLVLDLGVTTEATWRPGGGHRIRVEDENGRPLPISDDVARRLVADRPGALRIRVRHALPVGQGFGMSAAGALATALAVSRLLAVPRARAIEVAHLADLYGSGGLGGVAAILGGGVEIRTRPGIPPWGRIRHLPSERSVLIGVVGRPIPSPAILRDPRWLARIRRAAGTLESIGPSGSLDRLMDASERFTDRLGLADPSVRAVVRGIRRRGGRAAQAMFGTSFFALLPEPAARARVLAWLESERVRALEVGLDRRGARLLLRGRSGASLLAGGPSRRPP